MQESNAKKLRGRTAIRAAHGSITNEDEARLDLIISDLYGVDNDEAAEIHLNYHIDKMLAALAVRCKQRGITSESIADRLRYLDVSAVARQVVKGKLSEAAAIDSLFRSLQATQNQDSDDRYTNFYG
jgi:hypothetical protein